MPTFCQKIEMATTVGSRAQVLAARPTPSPGFLGYFASASRNARGPQVCFVAVVVRTQAHAAGWLAVEMKF